MTIHRDEISTIDFSSFTTGERTPVLSPGDVLRDEFMAPMQISARALARDLGIPANRVTAIMHGTRSITAETAILLSERFGNSAEFWLNLQMHSDLEMARMNRKHVDQQSAN